MKTATPIRIFKDGNINPNDLLVDKRLLFERQPFCLPRCQYAWMDGFETRIEIEKRSVQL